MVRRSRWSSSAAAGRRADRRRRYADARADGYPGLARIFFLVAVVAAALLALSIVAHDRSPRHQ
ncbi:MAG TPA: hypothetical protein VK886_19905 [Vicinamibacterales bacterium]|nr:hypothetical protein [Vicinamibacterales bacterium]